VTTLAELEQEVARRCGPFQLQSVDGTTPATSTVGYAVVPALQSLTGINTIDNLFLLRRDPAVTPDDRQRMVVDLDPNSGRVQVDRTWQVPPAPNEQLEFHHLDPAQELRPAVMAGLRRCLVQERVLLGPGYIYECDLTASLPWLTGADQVQRVQTGPTPSGWPGWWGGPIEVPFEVFMECGHVWLRVSGGVAWGPFYGGLLLTLIRTADSLTGDGCSNAVAADDDIIAIPVDYAAAACHIEAWKRIPARLQSASASGWQATQAMAAAEYTRQAYINEPKGYDRFAMRRSSLWSLGGKSRYGGSYTGGRTVVNS
jgi:hypothetical protein